MRTKVVILLFSIILVLYGLYRFNSYYRAYKKSPEDWVKMSLFLQVCTYIVVGILVFFVILVKILKDVF